MQQKVDFIQQPGTTSSVKLQSTSQSSACTKQRSWSLFGGLLLVWSTTAFWILAKPVYLRSMLSRLMKCPGDTEATAGTDQQERPCSSPKQCPTHATQPALQTLSKLGCEGSPHPLCSSHLSPTNYHFFTHLHNFLQGKHFHNQQHAQNAFQEPIESQSVGFYTIGINLFLIDKNVLIVMIPILINKEVFEPSYNDLKLMVWNCNYFCTSHVNH